MLSYNGLDSVSLTLTSREKLSAIGNLVGAALLGWAIFDRSDTDLQLSLLIGAPLVALIINFLGGRLLRLESEPLVPLLFFGPLFGLGFHAFDVPWVSVGDVPALAAACSGAITFAAFVTKRPRTAGLLTALTILFLFFLAAGSMLSWHFGSRQTSGPYDVKVQAKWEAAGRGSPDNELELGPIGPLPPGNTLKVSRADFQRVAVGDTICLSIVHGWSGTSWLDTEDC